MLSPFLWRREATHVPWKAKKKWKVQGWRIMYGGQGDDESRFSGMRWADSYWIFSDDRERLTCTVNDIIEELVGLDMEPIPQSQWWTSTYNAEERVIFESGEQEVHAPSHMYLLVDCLVHDGVILVALRDLALPSSPVRMLLTGTSVLFPVSVNGIYISTVLHRKDPTSFPL